MGVLIFSCGVEALLSAGGFFAPAALLTQFKLTPSPDTLFLGFVVAWFLLLTTLVCGLAIREVRAGRPVGWTLSYLLGGWWTAIGLALFFAYDRPDHLFLDALKGALMFLAAWKSAPGKSGKARR
jgi:hypothetical protein